MKVKDAIQLLQAEDLEADVMIQWYTKEDIEAFRGESLSPNEWSMATQLFDKWSSDNDYADVITCLEEARIRLTA